MTTTQRRAAVEISLFIVSLFIVWSVRATWLYAVDEAIASDTQRTVYSNLVKALLWVGPAFAFARWLRHASPWRYLGLSVAPSARQWARCLILTGLFLGLSVGLETLSGRKALSLAGFSLSITLSDLLFTFLSPLLEEILFRGLILHELSGLMPGWAANLLTSLLFVGIHLPFWLSHEGFTTAVLSNSIGVFAFSLLAGWLYLSSASIWPPLLAHIANNTLAALLVAGGR